MATWTDERVQELIDHMASGGIVQVTTYARSVLYDKRHISMFRCRNGALEIKRGRQWVDASYCCIRCGRWVEAAA